MELVGDGEIVSVLLSCGETVLVLEGRVRVPVRVLSEDSLSVGVSVRERVATEAARSITRIRQTIANIEANDATMIFYPKCLTWLQR